MVTQKKSVAEVMLLIARLPDVLEAAKLLYECKLIKVEPHEVVKLYVKKNPEINEVFSRMSPSLQATAKGVDI